MIFIDTWAWVALADKSDAYHRKAKAQHKKLTRTKQQYITTDYVVGETITHLYAALGSSKAKAFVTAVLTAADTGSYVLFHVSQQQFRYAWRMRQRYADKPDISFVDFTSMAVMQELGIVDVFTGDSHFAQVNLGFRLLP
jgi:predicted nucleic acid-binding protein